jgi:hypothetical protein
MKTLLVLLSVVLASILSCIVAIAAPPMPNDVQMVEPDPSLPKELADFWGKWEGSDGRQQFFLIVEKIDEGKASLYRWQSGIPNQPGGWERWEAKVIKEYGKYKLLHSDNLGPRGTPRNLEYTLKGKYLDSSGPRGGGPRYTRVP